MIGRDRNSKVKKPVGLAPWRWPLHVQILIGLVVGIGLGLLSGMTAVDSAGAGAGKLMAGRWDYLIYKLLGDLFLNALKLIIVPLVVSSIVLAVASIGEQSGFGRLSVKTLAYYLSTSLIAILIGLALVNLVRPGSVDGRGILSGQVDFELFSAETAEIAGKTGDSDATSFLDVFRQMVPTNFLGAAADPSNSQLLGLIVVSLVIGYMVIRLSPELRDSLLTFTRGVYELALMVTNLVLRLAPMGVCFLVASAFAMQYAKLVPDDRLAGLVGGIVSFALVAFAALMVHLLVVMPLILCLIARVNPIRHYRAMLPALLTAFSTASSSGTLPVTMECVEERAGVSNKTASFVLPLGATVNMDGTALYECVAAIFICQAFGIDLSFGQQFFVVVVALLTSIGVAEVPSASIVAIVVILSAVSRQVGLAGEGLVAGLFLIWLVDRPLDMVRTAVNVFSDSVGAVVIARTEGEQGVLIDPNTRPDRR